MCFQYRKALLADQTTTYYGTSENSENKHSQHKRNNKS